MYMSVDLSFSSKMHTFVLQQEKTDNLVLFVGNNSNPEPLSLIIQHVRSCLYNMHKYKVWNNTLRFYRVFQWDHFLGVHLLRYNMFILLPCRDGLAVSTRFIYAKLLYANLLLTPATYLYIWEWHWSSPLTLCMTLCSASKWPYYIKCRTIR